MRNMLIIMMGVVLFHCAIAGAVEMTASVDKRVVSLGDRVVLSVRVTDASQGAAPALPSMDGFRVEAASQSSEIQIVNGVSSMATQYDYVLSPLKTGRFIIGSVSLAQQGRVYRTSPIVVEVREGGQEAPSPPPGEEAGEQGATAPAREGREPMFIELTADKKEAFIHEQVILAFRFYFSAGLAEQPVYEAPPAPGCIEKILGDGKSVNYTRVLNGMRYQVSELKTALYPYQTGEITVGPARLRGSVLAEAPGRPRRPGGVFGMEDFFDDPFFGRFNRKPFQLLSNDLKLMVKPLPGEGAPQGEVSVGRYRLQVEAKPREVRAGDPVTLTMTVSGEGDIESVAAPRLRETEGFKTYEATSSTEAVKSADRVTGIKRFEQAIVPLSDKIREIPEIVFNYFDPGEAKYVVLKEGPVPIRVLPPRDEGGAKIVSLPGGAEKRGVKLLERNIVFIKGSPGVMTRAGRAGGMSLLFRAMQCVPPLLVLLAFLHARHRERLRSDIGYARLYHTARMTRARLASAEEALRHGDVEVFYGALVRAMNMYIADRIGVPSGGLTPEIIHDKLGEKGIRSELLQDIDEFTTSCEFARFASVKPDREEMQHALRRAMDILEELRRRRF